MILPGIPAAPFLAPQTEALEQGLRESGPAGGTAFLQMLVHDASSVAVTAGGYGWAVQKGMRWRGGKNWRRGG